MMKCDYCGSLKRSMFDVCGILCCSNNCIENVEELLNSYDGGILEKYNELIENKWEIRHILEELESRAKTVFKLCR